MRRKLLVLLALVVVLSLVMAVPVGAKKPAPNLRGDQTMVLNMVQDEESGNPIWLYGCPGISWFGSIVIDGETYGMALYSIDSYFTGGGTILHWEEGWAIFAEEFAIGNDGKIVACLDPVADDALLAGTDKGVGNIVIGKFRSNGIVEEAFDPFEEWEGRKVHQDGLTGLVSVSGLENVFGFKGDLRLN